MNRHWWLTAGAAMLAAASSAHAQLRLGRDPILTNIHSAELPTQPNSVPAEFNFFGDSAPGNRLNNTGSLQLPAETKGGYLEILVFQDGRELRGTRLDSEGPIIRWSRPDASEPLRFPRSEIRKILSPSAWEKPLSDDKFSDPAAIFAEAASAGAASLPLAALSWLYFLAGLPALAPRDILVF
jgi:hypothetical protein